MIEFWHGYEGPVTTTPPANAAASSMAIQARNDVRVLQDQVDRLALLNQALWELLKTRLNLTDDELEQMAQHIDLRDGKQDGKMTDVAVQCPTCHRICNARHEKCLYCSQPFEKNLFQK